MINDFSKFSFFVWVGGGGKGSKSLEYFVILGELDFMLDTAQTSHSCDGFKNYWGGVVQLYQNLNSTKVMDKGVFLVMSRNLDSF